MDLANILSSLAGNDTVNEISKKFNIDTNKVSSVITSALPTLIGAMQKNASTESGAAALAKALGDHAGNANSMISNLKNVDLTDGSKILGKILGGNASSIFDKIGKQTGTTSGQVSNILSSIAPALMNMLGKLKGNNTGNDALGALLGSVLGGGASNNAGGLGSILGGLGKIFGGK
ncbi:MAG: DUF937 domain-containing protein [Bacteroidales bacterium]|nr:DUF937 domain-containing protein [Bacteroidales bacterium]